MGLPLLEVFVQVLPGENKPLLLGHLGGVRLALLLYGEIVFLRQPPYDGSQSNLLLDLLGQSGVQNPGIDVATWWAKPMKFFEDLGILLFGGSPVSNLPPTLSFRILISCCVQGHRLFCRPVSNRRLAKVLYESLLPIMDVAMCRHMINRIGKPNTWKEMFQHGADLRNYSIRISKLRKRYSRSDKGPPASDGHMKKKHGKSMDPSCTHS